MGYCFRLFSGMFFGFFPGVLPLKQLSLKWVRGSSQGGWCDHATSFVAPEGMTHSLNRWMLQKHANQEDQNSWMIIKKSLVDQSDHSRVTSKWYTEIYGYVRCIYNCEDKMGLTKAHHVMSELGKCRYIHFHLKETLTMRSPGSSNTVDATSTRIALDLFEIKRCLVHEGASVALLHSDFFRFESFWDWQMTWFFLTLSLETRLCWNWHDESHITESFLKNSIVMIINPNWSWAWLEFWCKSEHALRILRKRSCWTRASSNSGCGQVHSQWSSAFGCSCRQGDFLPKRDAMVFEDIIPGGAFRCSQHQPFRGRLADAALVLCLTFMCVSWEEVVDRCKPFATWRAAHGRMRRVEGCRRQE